ncbi:MAG: hypothetical protein K0B05_01415 [Bacteroidales bacterium]|nr:hypothetical protein [Bacteroidales bacterium]
MENITSVADIKNAIQILEEEQTVRGEQLKEQLHLTFESLKPVNLIKSTIKDISSSPYLIDNILGTATGLASGYLSRKIIVGASGNILRKLFGVVLQLGVTNLVARHPDEVKSLSHLLFQRIFRKKAESSEKP